MKYTLEQIESLMVKARLLGTLNQLKTKCGHVIYLIKDILDGDVIIYIPDDVETAEEKERIPDEDGNVSYPTYCDIECKTLIVSGGRNLKDANSMFFKCKAQSIDLSDFNTSQVTNMVDMFRECGAELLDLSSFDTSNVTDMSFMFSYCTAQSLDLSNFDTSKVTDMAAMFVWCKAKEIIVGKLDISNVTSVKNMFNECRTEVLDLDGLTQSDSLKDASGMFIKCTAKKIKLNNFRLGANVKTGIPHTREGMFNWCNADIEAACPIILERLREDRKEL